LNTNIIEVRKLEKSYGDLTAVKGISFDVQKSEILGILGPNGSGKTTTLKSILGLIEFDHGTVHVGGLSIQKERKRILERTGAVLEGARNTYWYLSPRENLSYFAALRGLSRKEASGRIEYLLESLDLKDVADKELRQFSAGMKQKCALACAFVHDPDILLLDEPTLGLDVEISRLIRDWLRRIVSEEGKTILITSHDMDFIESVCGRILIIRKGEIISHETVASLKERFAGKYFDLELSEAPSPLLMERMSQLGQISAEGSRLRAELQVLDNLLPMLTAISESGIFLTDIRTVENDLEDIFIQMIKEPPHEDH